MAQGFAQTHNEAVPAGTDWIRDGDNAIRNLKIAERERFAVDHYSYADETGYTNVGMHKQITLGERATDPTNVTDFGFVYTKNDGGDTELYWMDAAGNITQFTKDGYIYGNYVIWDNASPIQSWNNAGDGFIDMIWVNSSDQVVVPDGLQNESGDTYTTEEAVAIAIAANPVGIGVGTGTVAHGGTIPLPAGYDQGDCYWLVSANNQDAQGNSYPNELDCSADGTRVVTCQVHALYAHDSSVDDKGWKTGTANYIIIGVS